MAKIDNDLATLSEEQRDVALGRATTLQAAITKAHGDLAQGLPDPEAVWKILRIACFDSPNDLEAMEDAEDMLEGLADRLDVQAMQASDDSSCGALRDAERTARTLASAVMALRHAELDLTPEGSSPAPRR